MNQGPDVSDNTDNHIIDKLVKIIAKTPVDLTMEELFQIAPHCKEAVMRKLEGTPNNTLPRVPVYHAKQTTVLDKGAVVRLSVWGEKIKFFLLDRGSTVSLMNEQTYRMIGKTI